MDAGISALVILLLASVVWYKIDQNREARVRVRSYGKIAGGLFVLSIIGWMIGFVVWIIGR